MLEGALAAGGHDGRAGATRPALLHRGPDLVLHRLDAEVEARVQGEVLEVVSKWGKINVRPLLKIDGSESNAIVD